MWDRRVVDKVEEYTVAYSFKNVEDNFKWACRKFFYGRRLLGYKAGGTCLGALVVASTFPSERSG